VIIFLIFNDLMSCWRGAAWRRWGGKAHTSSAVQLSPPLAPSRLRAFQAGVFLPSFSLIFNDLHICLCPCFGRLLFGFGLFVFVVIFEVYF